MTEAPFFVDKHVEFIEQLDKDKENSLEYWMSEHLRLNAVYWALTSMHLLGRPVTGSLDREKVIDYVKSCWNETDGGFGGHEGHDSHLLYTLSAVQILVILDVHRDPAVIDTEKVIEYVLALKNPDGSFRGDIYQTAEVDTRFSYCALSCLSLLGAVDRLSRADVNSVVAFIDNCQNFDGGFGSVPSAESHAGQIFCCLGALKILGRLDQVVADKDRLALWLADRQLPDSGGLNGRPEKLPDVCYSWWVLSSLCMLKKQHWIDGDKLTEFILAAQDAESGGIADRPGDVADVFHTLFGIAGLSMLGYAGLQKVDPVYCMPIAVLEKLKMK